MLPGAADILPTDSKTVELTPELPRRRYPLSPEPLPKVNAARAKRNPQTNTIVDLDLPEPLSTDRASEAPSFPLYFPL